jgi:hypothetical protein
MSFGGGGGGSLPNHEHTNIALDGGPLDFVNTTIASLSANSMTYSDGAALQELTIGADAQVLGVSGSTPTWITNTSNPLVKVTKTFADISSGSLDIYTLPEDSALCNIWADITTVFDQSTSVTIGDSADNDGFQTAQDFTASTGLTNATRGNYITSFQTMRSTSGNTDIKAYNFGSSSLFDQPLEGTARGFNNGGGRLELAQQFNAGHVLVGTTINNVTFKIGNIGGGPTGVLSCYIRESDGTLIATSPDTVDMTTLTVPYQTFNFSFPNTALAATDMITIAGAFTNAGTTDQRTQATEMTNGKLYATSTVGSGYGQLVGEEMTMTVSYNLTTDTQGAVDFYLQVVD